jgi:drug/metabolite transporter (DMT)-like permease
VTTVAVSPLETTAVPSQPWLRLLVLLLLGAAVAWVGYLVQQKRPPKKPSASDPTSWLTAPILLVGAFNSLSEDTDIASQACLVVLVAWLGSWLARAWHGD